MMRLKRFFIIFFLLSLILSCNESKRGLYEIPQYKKWRKPVSYVLDRPVPGHGSTYRIIYANSITFSAKSDKKTGNVTMPNGSVVIKEVYKKKEYIDKVEPELTIMVKNTGDPESLNGWNYYVKHPGKGIQSVKSRMCVGCHVSANEEHPYFDGNKDEKFRDS